MTEKVQSCVYLERSIKKKLGRISHILKIAESQVVEDALCFYFENSNVTEEAQKKIVEYKKFSEELGATEKREFTTAGGKISVCEYRPEYKEDEQ